MTATTRAYLYGYLGRRAGEKVGDNPYSEEDQLHFAWLAGWTQCAVDRSGIKTELPPALDNPAKP